MPSPSEEDTIVVKEDHGRHRLLLPDSNKSVLPKRQSLSIESLAQFKTPQKLESPVPSDEGGVSLSSSQSMTRLTSTKRTPIKSIRKHRVPVTTMEERLQAMPVKRALPWRAGVEAGADVETGGESRRKQIRFGCLLATRGDVAPVPCISCATGRGKFDLCIALEGYFKGACASCQLSGRPNRCSIKQNDDDLSSPGGNVTPSPKGRVKDAAGLQPSIPYHSKKRRRVARESEVENTDIMHPKEEYELADPSTLDRMPMNEIIPAQRPWATVNAPALTTTPLQGSRNGVQEGYPSHTLAWAAVNQRASNSTPHNPMANNGRPDSMRSSAGRAVRHERLEHGTHGESAPPEEGSGALIDTLSKTKQRQVFGVISGLQGGIDQLQRELTNLKKALGMDDED